jgi:uncharacterized membrane protein HdeD (DUF308 family)
MLLLLGRYWWLFLLRGVLSALFGLALLFLPGLTLEILLLLLALFLILDGTISFGASLKGRNMKVQWQYLSLEGLVGIAIGALALMWPKVTVVAVAVLIGVWAFFSGVFEILASIRLRSEVEGEWLLSIAGILSILFGTLLFLHPGLSIAAMLMVLGIYSILFGGSLIILGLRLRKHNLIINL